MNKQDAERFEEAMQHGVGGEIAQGKLASLVETARQAHTLAGPVPPPPHRLAPGRQRLLAEAARLRPEVSRVRTMGRRKEQGRMTGVMKLGVALVAVMLVAGLVFGTGQVMADSLPGEPLYGLKLAAEETRLALTTAPQSRADLGLVLAEERMNEVEALLEQQRPVDNATAARVQQQLEVALESAVQEQNAAAAGTLQQLALAIEQRQQKMEELATGSSQPQVRQILRAMNQVREEAHAGVGDPEGLRQRLRRSLPTVPAVEPGSGSGPGPQPAVEPGSGSGPGPQPAIEPGSGPGPGPQPAVEPGSGPGPGPQPAVEPGSGPGPGPQPAVEPGSGPGPGPQPTVEPGSGPGPGPQPTMEPGSGPGPGPQPTVEPGGGPGPGPQPTVEPGSGPGPGPQPTAEPGNGQSSWMGGSQRP
jgi:hypothetical protein